VGYDRGAAPEMLPQSAHVLVEYLQVRQRQDDVVHLLRCLQAPAHDGLLPLPPRGRAWGRDR
jgi:hypothetical protein